MKKLALILTGIVLLSSCSPKAYVIYVNNGESIDEIKKLPKRDAKSVEALYKLLESKKKK